MNTEDTIKIINRILEDYKINNVESVLGTIVEDLRDGSYSVDIGGKEYPALKVKNLYSFDLSEGKGVYVGYPSGDKSLLCILAPADIEIPEEEEIDINPVDSVTSEKIYIADASNYRIQIFDTDFNFLSKIDMPGEDIYGVVADTSGNIYVNAYSKIMKYSSTGTFISDYTPAEGVTILSYSDDYLYFSNADGVLKADADFNIISQCATQYGGPFWHEFGLGLAVSDTNIMATYTNMSYQKNTALISSSLVFSEEDANTDLEVIQYYNGYYYSILSGSLLKINKAFTGGEVAYTTVGSIAEGPFFISSNYIYILSGNTVKQYTLTAELIETFLESGSGDGQLSNPSGIFIK